MSKFQYVIKRTGAIVPFNPERISNAIYRAAVSVGGRDKSKAEELGKDVLEVLEATYPEGYKPNIEEIQDIVEKVLVEKGHAKVAKEYILYRQEANKRREADSMYFSKPSENIPWAKVWRSLDWSVSHNLNTIEKLNERINNGEFAQIVHESETCYETQIDTAADMISQRSHELKMVMVSGPSSSGKTTTTYKLEQRLKKLGMSFVPLIVDNYFFDLELHPKDEFGDYDFETPHALDLELLNDHLKKLAAGEGVMVPFYDFKTGKRFDNRDPLQLEKGQILLIDSLHGLHPEFSKEIPAAHKFKLYLEPLLQLKGVNGKYIRWTDIRLVRRMLRDSVHRAYKPEQTLLHWHYVRSAEKRHILPNQVNADYIVNTSMTYEIPLYAHRLKAEFNEWKTKYKDDPLRIDAYERAVRMGDVLNSVVAVSDDSPVPADSVLREFIGGSSFENH